MEPKINILFVFILNQLADLIIITTDQYTEAYHGITIVFYIFFSIYAWKTYLYGDPE